MVHYFNNGGAIMWPLLFCAVVGVAITIVKFWLLFRSTINAKKFYNQLLGEIKSKGVKGGIELCEKTRGPMAALLHAGLERTSRSLESVERGIENEAAIQLGTLERGMVWLSSVISVAPMLGFLGTVQGMIIAFEQIAKSNDIIPSEVAYGISVALITTFAGLTIAIPIQICFNFFVNKVDRMVVEMEDYANKMIEYLLDNDLIAK
jgi:biopolymer transport protein ExbB